MLAHDARPARETGASTQSRSLHHADHFHAKVDHEWRSAGPVFAEPEGAAIRHGQRSFEVSHAPVAEATRPMPREIARQYPNLVRLSALASEAAVARLQLLVDRHPEVPTLGTLLAAALSRAGRMREALVVVEKTCLRSPNDLFAKIQYAQLCLTARRPEAAARVFDRHFDLALLYPHRTTFHISEFTAFAAVAGEYFWQIGHTAVARSYCQTLQHVAPGHQLTGRLLTLMGGEA